MRLRKHSALNSRGCLVMPLHELAFYLRLAAAQRLLQLHRGEMGGGVGEASK